MLKKLLSALFGRKKQEAERDKPTHPEKTTIRREARRRNAMPAASRSTSSSPAARQDDILTNPLHPLSPLNSIDSDEFNRRADAWIDSRCDDDHRSSCNSNDISYSISD